MTSKDLYALHCSDAVDAAFEGTREQFLAALHRYEMALMQIKEAFQNGQRIHST